MAKIILNKAVKLYTMKKSIKLKVTYNFKGVISLKYCTLVEGLNLVDILPTDCQIINITFYDSL